MEKKGSAKPVQMLKERARQWLRSLELLVEGRWLAWVSLGLMVIVTVGGLFYLAGDWNRARWDSSEDFYWSEPLVPAEPAEIPAAEPSPVNKATPEPGPQPPATIPVQAEVQPQATDADPGPAPEEPLAPVLAAGQAFSDLAYPVQAQVTSAFGWRKHPVFADWRYHPGVDLKVAPGTEVKAVLSGMVAEVKEDDIFGKMVVIDHGVQRSSTYSHLDEMKVEVGQAVEKGEVIGTVGQTGIAHEPHLHLELRLEGTALDPALYLPVLEETAPVPMNE
ncbi:MAG: M23 family metallopeptidase [bacterium]|jgi:murein DD-endopeptidase MepM/ murein hydrolase activator NlpD